MNTSGVLAEDACLRASMTVTVKGTSKGGFSRHGQMFPSQYFPMVTVLLAGKLTTKAMV